MLQLGSSKVCALCCLLTAALLGCSESSPTSDASAGDAAASLDSATDSPGTDASGFEDEPLVLTKATKVLDEAGRASLVAFEPDGTLVFRDPAPSFAPDDVVVSRPAPAAPSGLLRKVLQVQRQGAHSAERQSAT